MAAGAALIGQVQSQALAVRPRLVLGEGRKIHVGAWRRERNSLAQEAFPDEKATGGRRRLGGFACQSQESSLPENARPLGAGRKCHAGKFGGRGRQVVERGEIGAHERVVRAEEFHEVAIVPHQIGDEAPCLLRHCQGQFAIELRKAPPFFGLGHQLVEAQPLRDELVDGLPGLRAREHSAGRPFQPFGSVQLSRSRAAEQRVVGRAIPEKAGEPGRARVRLPLRHGARVQEEKVRRLQHRLDDDLCPLQEIGLLLEKRRITLNLGAGQRTSKRLQAEFTDESRAALRIGWGSGPARNQSSRVAAAEGAGGKFLCGYAVGLGQQRRDALRLILVLETVDEILGRKLSRGMADVAKEIARGVVVLAVCEPAQDRKLLCLRRRLRAGGKVCRRNRGQAPDPGSQHGLVAASGSNPLSSDVRHPVRGLFQQKGVFRVRGIDESPQRVPELLDPRLRRALLRKLQARHRSHAVRVMTGVAARLFENRIDVLFEANALACGICQQGKGHA